MRPTDATCCFEQIVEAEPKKRQLYGHLPPWRQRDVERCWKSKDELMSDVLLWTLIHGPTSISKPARTDIHQLSTDTGCRQDDLSGAMDDRKRWWERVKELCAVCVAWSWIFCFIFESFPYPDNQGTSEEGKRIQQPKPCGKTNSNKD